MCNFLGTVIKWSNWNKWSWAKHVDRNIQTCTILLMTIGSMLRGKRRMLKSASDTKAFWASSTLCSSISTYTVNVDKATYLMMETKAERSDQSQMIFIIVLNSKYSENMFWWRLFSFALSILSKFLSKCEYLSLNLRQKILSSFLWFFSPAYNPNFTKVERWHKISGKIIQ